MVEKKTDIEYALMEGCQHGEVVGGLTRNKDLLYCDWSGVHTWLSLVGPKVGNLMKLPVINQVLIVWG